MNLSNPISRRSFLAGTAKLGAAALATATVEPLFSAAPDKPWQIGCYTRVFDQFEYPVALDAIAEAGFKYVGLMTIKSKEWVMIKTTTPLEEVRAMNDAARQRGLKVLSVYGDFSVTGSLSRPKTDLLDKLTGIRIGQDLGGLIKNLFRPAPAKPDPDAATPTPPGGANGR